MLSPSEEAPASEHEARAFKCGACHCCPLRPLGPIVRIDLADRPDRLTVAGDDRTVGRVIRLGVGHFFGRHRCSPFNGDLPAQARAPWPPWISGVAGLPHVRCRFRDLQRSLDWRLSSVSRRTCGVSDHTRLGQFVGKTFHKVPMLVLYPSIRGRHLQGWNDNCPKRRLFGGGRAATRRDQTRLTSEPENCKWR